MSVNKLYGKLILTGKVQVKTGMHIGGSSEFSAIGAVDSIVIKDTVTKLPIIPGSSLKGKMRYLLARVYSDSPQLKDIRQEAVEIKRLFGTADKGDDMFTSRLQFSDMMMTEESRDRIVNMEPDLYVTEIKFENTISRITAVANPRQIERVPAGAEFEFKLVYNIEDLSEVDTDIENIRTAMSLLQEDYLGGHGTRGYGRVVFSDLSYDVRSYNGFDVQKVEDAAKKCIAL
jgi:CRISPR-associated protein Csm3